MLEREEALLWAALEPAIASCELLVLSDYAKGVLTPEICRLAIEAAVRRGIPVIVDPKDSDFTKYRGASVITPNYGEAAAAARRVDPAIAVDESDATAEAIGSLLMRTYGSSLVLTRGSKGMTVLDATGSTAPIHIAARARRVFDVTGAGDTVVAVLALALAAGLSLETAAAMSTEAAGFVIELPGTAMVTLDELQRASREADR